MAERTHCLFVYQSRTALVGGVMRCHFRMMAAREHSAIIAPPAPLYLSARGRF